MMLRLRNCMAGPSAVRVLSSAAAASAEGQSRGGSTQGGNSSSSSHTPRITITPAIKRSPTDLLQALSDTVGVDPTAPHFAFVDDPVMIPSTTQAMRHYYMAKELGKRAARQLAEEWPTLFMFDRDYPRLPVFRPEMKPDPLQVEPSEDNLLKMIEQRDVRDAVMLYERMRSDNKDVSNETQFELFKLVTYYNGENVPFAEWEEWHGLRNYGETKKQAWTEAGIADLLYETLPKTPETKSILIAGLCKYPSDESVKRAKKLMQDMMNAKEAPFVEAFNGLIATNDKATSTWALEQMKAAKVRPNIDTFNALILSQRNESEISIRQKKVKDIINSMLALGVEPSLTSYNILLSLMEEVRELAPGTLEKKINENEKKKLGFTLHWLNAILTRLESLPRLEVQSQQCNFFFSQAMIIASEAANLPLAERILALYESDKNHVKMPAFTVENMFYSRYLNLHIERSPMPVVEKKYCDLVPRFAAVTKRTNRNILMRIKDSPSWRMMRRVIEDGVNARYMSDGAMGALYRSMLLGLSLKDLSVMEREEYVTLVKKLVDVWIELSRFTEERNKRLQFKLSPMSTSECALLLHRIGESEKAYDLLEMLLDKEAKFGDNATIVAQGQVHYASMDELFQEALREGNATRAAVCFEIMSHYTPRNKLELYAQNIIDKCRLSEPQARIISGYVKLRPQ